MLRMFRIIRLLHSFPSLRAVVESLMVAFQNVVYLLFLIVLINFISAAAGMLMFRENDPHNFGTLPAAMISVWMVEVRFGFRSFCFCFRWCVCVRFCAVSHCACQHADIR
jgi:hypothetical protein